MNKLNIMFYTLILFISLLSLVFIVRIHNIAKVHLYNYYLDNNKIEQNMYYLESNK